MEHVSEITGQGLGWLSSLFVLVVGMLLLLIAILFIKGITQTKDAIRHNYPVTGRFRYIFSTLGEFFRQYFFAMDREEMPFNRAEREWVYKSKELLEFIKHVREVTGKPTGFIAVMRSYGWRESMCEEIQRCQQDSLWCGPDRAFLLCFSSARIETEALSNCADRRQVSSA